MDGETVTYYKAFRSDGRTLLGRPAWPLPKDNEPGEWVEVEGPLVPYQNGLHVMRECDLSFWPGPILYEVEVDGETVTTHHEVVARRARLLRKIETWNERTLCAWLADCVDRVLLVFEKECPEDDGPRRAIEAIRAWLRGEITMRQLIDAACVIKLSGPSRVAVAVESAAINAMHAAISVAAAEDGTLKGLVDSLTTDCTGLSTCIVVESIVAVVRASAATSDSDAADAERKWQAERMMQYIRGEVKP